MNEHFLHISAGNGPEECQWVVAKLARAFTKEARAYDIKTDILSGDIDETMSSVLLKLTGTAAEEFSNARIGTIKWIGQSPFRSNHKRKNWYVGVARPPRISDFPELRAADIRFQSMKASGPGGQHVNATQSAVRATHIPTGLSVVAREERSQHANKKLTLIKLAMLFDDQKRDAHAQTKARLWQEHKNLERGNEVRIYRGDKFKLVSK